EYNDDSVLDATQNYWGSNLPEAIARRVLDGNIYATRGKANYRPFLTRTEPASGCQSVNECSGHGVCTGVDQCQCNSGFAGADCSQFSCVDVSSCGQNGKCSGPNTCICNAGWFGTDCSRPTCAQVNDCSGHGTCVSLNECSCFVGFSGKYLLNIQFLLRPQSESGEQWNVIFGITTRVTSKKYLEL
uniref:EGF-like domain-containing protein n=1 Tax=Plectus sambesii TaxID=2011161 RepID=A0A914UX30_9BILA